MSLPEMETLMRGVWREEGCSCVPDIEWSLLPPRYGVPEAVIRHDDWCPMSPPPEFVA